VLLVCILSAWFSAKTRVAALPVAYLGAIDGKGHWKLRFAITNVGKSTVFTSTQGQIEVLNHTNIMGVGVTAPMSRLDPGQGHVVDAVLSETQMKSLNGKWRFTCLYADDGLRSRIHHWQWGPNGPGARVNWLVPQKLRGMPLTVKITGDWTESPK